MNKKILISFTKNILIRNVNHTKFMKKCLLIYVTKPFVYKGKVTHPNHYKSHIINSCLKEQGYNVDVIYYGYTRHINYSKYDLIIGMGEGYSKSYGKCKQSCKRIYLATGTCFTIANELEMKRWISLLDRGKGYLGNHRLDLESNPVLTLQSLYNSDAIISGGDNEWVRESYSWTNLPYYSVGSLSIVDTSDVSINRNIGESRKQLLFLCGNGCIHKGLDLVVEVISNRPEYSLIIAGNIDNGFLDVYNSELNNDNITVLSFVDVNSREFLDICKKCSFIVSLSCSEGSCTSILTGMDMGLIPIVSHSDGVNIGESGFLLNEPSREELDRILDQIKSLTDEELLAKSIMSKQIIDEKYSRRSFYMKFKKALSEILNNE